MRVPSRKFHTHAHLDLIVWSVFSIRSGFSLCNICGTSMRPLHSQPWAPQKALLEIGRRKVIQWLGEESYTLSDLRESFEEKSFILIWKSFKRPKLFSRRSKVGLILHVGLNCYTHRGEDYRLWKRITRKVHHSLQFAMIFICQGHQLNFGKEHEVRYRL